MGTISEVATTVAESAVPIKKLRIKIPAKKPMNEACEISKATVVNSFKKQPMVDGRSKALTVERKLESNQGSKRVTGCLGKSLVSQNRMTPVIDYTAVAGSKRRSEGVLEGRERKRLKMDRSVTLYCQSILTKLMKDKLGGPFCTPVDPKVWAGIDDYFVIIKKPMDLGTVMNKLQRNTYTHVEEFEADVRLTFSNAMLYNPPDNWVHKSAKELDMLFTRLWRFEKIRMDGGYKSVTHQVGATQRSLVSSHDKIIYHTKVKADGEQRVLKQQVDIKQRGHESSHDKSTSDGKGKFSVNLSSQVGLLPRKTMLQKKKSSGEQPSYTQFQEAKPQEHVKELNFTTFSSATECVGATALGLENMDVEVSPSMALRAASLMSRYADTILKAQTLQPI